jgi:hypothetical protein
MSEDPLKHPKSELKAAQNSFENMKNSNSFEEFEEHWKTYLFCIEKVWNKTERCCAEFGNFQPWQGQYKTLRKKDELLQYLKQARDTDIHSIQDISTLKKSRLQINPVNKGEHYIEKMVIANGQLQHYEGDPIKVEFTPATIKANRVKNNGRWYNPPKAHLGVQLSSKHPVEIAQHGIAFYTDFMDKVHEKFFT